MICGAKTRTSGLCQKHGMANGRCRLHGGLSPKGRDHWNYQHGQCTMLQRAINKRAGEEIRILEFFIGKLNMVSG